MNFFRRMTHWIRRSNNTILPSTTVILSDKVEQARRAQYAEQYDDALKLLAEAMNIAEEQRNATIKVDIMLSRADILIAREDYETASFLLNELRDESESRQHRAPLAYALASLGIIEQKRGNLDAANDLYEESRKIAEVIQTDGASGRAAAHLADIYLLEGNASYAIYLLKDAIPRLIHSGDKELLGYFQGRLGDALIASGQAQEGIVALQQGLESAFALKHQAQVRDISQKLGRHALQLADYDKAIQYLRDALGLYDKATYSPDTVVLLCQLSRAFYSNNKPRESLEYAKQANENIEIITDTSVMAMAKAALGLALSAVGKNDEALSHLQDAEQAYADLDADAFYMDILRNLASSQAKNGNIDSAIATYERAIEKGQSLPFQVAQIYTDFANLLAAQGDYKAAIDYHRKTIQYYTDSHHGNFVARSYCALGTIYMQFGDGKMARREYEQALVQLNTMDDTTTRGYVLALVANVYTEFGDMESAESFYKEAIEIAKRDNAKEDEALRRGAYGRFLALTNKPKRAAIEIQQAQHGLSELGLTIESALQWGNAGLAYAVRNEHEKALEQYNIALAELEANPHSAVIRANRADSCVALARYEEAYADYDAALATAREANNLVVVVQALIGLAFLYLESNTLERVEQCLNKAESIIRRANLRRLEAHLLRVQSRLCAVQGDAIKAQSVWEESAKLRSILRMPDITPDWL